MHRLPLTLFIAALTGLAPVSAQTDRVLVPVADTTLFSESSMLANGGDESVFAGTELVGAERRALLRFDLETIPAGAMILAAELRLTMTRTRSGPVAIRLHALSADWGEGEADGPMGGGGGAPAQPGDATWRHRRLGSAEWNTPGGDFDPMPVSEALVSDPGSYLFASTPELVNRVQSWVDGTRANDGLILVADPGAGDPSAKRFGSRENPDDGLRPRLIVTYGEGTPPLAVSGLWFDPALDGEGYNVIQADAGLVVFFYGYSAAGERLWLVSETLDAELRAGQAVTLALFRGPPGSFAVPTPSAQLEPWGELTVVLDSCTAGRFELDGADGVKVSEVIKLAGITGTTCADRRR